MHKTIEKNLARVSRLVDEDVQLSEQGFPLFNWLELSPIDTCNRSCVFCPKTDPSKAPNQPHVMPPMLYQKLADELKAINYQGTVMLAGYGEPLLSKHIVDMVSVFSAVCNTEITTNGDPLNKRKIQQLLDAGVGKIVVSMYDGPEQIDHYKHLFSQANAPLDSYILRDRWYGESEEYGLKLTNRAGVLSFGEKVEKLHHHPCYYPDYMMMVDWNGDVMLCTQDWNRRIKSGNLSFNSLVEVWQSKLLKRYRSHLHAGKRDLPPCNQCNATGTLHGKKQALLWDDYYADKQINIKIVESE
ncbi:radical SAM/SPASM domain-containing protein [Psychromonas aquimarina]|uniref:radical SAM/SPASM domain-containing protein n=1 Tax=Psychromonas aquimarina TaxID=444919 RepID=UPI000418B699|nr:radical SAM/SPASM domain-containing protein [Psychromonas aquimarina]